MRNLYILGMAFLIGLSACDTPGSTSRTSSTSAASGEARPYKVRTVKESSTSGEITIAVDETYEPLIKSAISTFEATYPKAKIHALYMAGEDAVEAMLNNDTIRLVITSRILSPGEEAVLREQTSSSKPSRFATDAIAFITHKDNPTTRMPTQTMLDILTGELNTWQAADEKSTLTQEIQVVVDQAQSSTIKFLQDSVLGDKPLRTQNIAAGKSNKEVIEYVAATPHSLGIIGLPWISDRDDNDVIAFLDKVNVMGFRLAQPCAFSNEYKSFQPYQAFIKKECYPFSRGVYAVLRESHLGLGTGFVSYLSYDPGQRIVHKAGLVPESGITRIVKFPSKAEQKRANQE